MTMKVVAVNAFTKDGKGGNPAGVVWLEAAGFPPDEEMQILAEEVGFSETAFVRYADASPVIFTGGDASDDEGEAEISRDVASSSCFETRYFTPTDEVDLCGHATIASFFVLREKGILGIGDSTINIVNAGDLSIEILDDGIFMEAAESMKLADIKRKSQLKELYSIMGIDSGGDMEKLPMIVSAGLPDILLPVATQNILDDIKPDFDKLSELSEMYGVVGVHAYAVLPDDEDCIHVRNFAPLYGIDEESATGTSNAALAYRLYLDGELGVGDTAKFVQGESMNSISEILCQVRSDETVDDGIRIWIGGKAVYRH